MIVSIIKLGNVSFRRSLQTKTNIEIHREAGLLVEDMATAGVITLNRPKNLNYLDRNTWIIILERLRSWGQTKTRVIIKGAGEKAFCAGGNIKFLLNKGRDREKRAFITAMHNAIYLLSKYKIPYISLMDGITFGGGVALANGRYRVATERTVVANPETRIGWLTDASAPYYLPRLDKHLGFYMAMTGTRLIGADVVAAGLATHYVPSALLKELEFELCHCNDEDIEARLNAFSKPVRTFSFAAIMDDVDYSFSADTVEEIIERLSIVNNSWSTKTIAALSQMCPTMLKVSLRALQFGKEKELKECLHMEHRVLIRCMGSYNAQEGVRALLVDKDQPRWQPATITEVSDAIVESYFAPLPEGEELKLLDK